MAVGQQTDNRRYAMRMRCRVHLGTVELLRLGYSLEQQHHGPAHRCHIDWFIGGVQDQDWLLHQRTATHHNGAVDSTACGAFWTGHSIPRSIEGTPPPRLERFWPSCAHPASYRVNCSEP